MKFRAMTSWLRWSIFGVVLSGGTLITSAAQAQGRGDAVEFVDVLIQFRQPPGPEQEFLVRRMGGNVTRTFQIVPAVAATVPVPALQALALHRDVVVIEEDMEVQAHDIASELAATWGVEKIAAGLVHSIPVTGAGVKVAICDTGIDYTHPELANNYSGGKDFVTGDSNPIDEQWHGTHVAGTVAAVQNGTGVVGVAPNARLYACRVLDRNGSGQFSWIISALDWCVVNQIQVANFSLGSSGYPGSTVEQAFANAERAGIVLVCSAGNSGAGPDTVGYPAKFSSCIAVASTTTADTRSSFSSTGPAVEIAAPGSDIVSTYPRNRFATASGTSMACPHVTGVAALILAKGVTDTNSNLLVNDEVREILKLSALDTGIAGKDNEFGFGRVDSAVAVAMAPGGETAPTDPTLVFAPPSNLVGSASRSVSLQWFDNSNVEDGFEIRFGVTSNGVTSWRGSFTVGTNVRTATHSPGRGTWQYQVRAIQRDPNLETAWSNQIQVTVK